MALTVDVPFPYKQFTDSQFFLVDKNGKFISEKYYTLSPDRRVLTFTSPSSLGISKDDDVRFTFCHNHGRYHIHKKEIHIDCVGGKQTYDIPSPFGKLVDLETRYVVFYNRLRIDIRMKDYHIDSIDGKLHINPDAISIASGDTLDIVCFYTGNRDTDAIPYLPMSGYIELKRHEIDRNYNNNLMAIFINGKLIPRELVTHMSNNLYKINKDIKTRYNLDIRNMSPRIASIAPFYQKNFFNEEIETIHRSWYDLSCEVTVPCTPKGRRTLEDFIDPIMLDPSIFEGLPFTSYYITLFHHGVLEDFDDNGSISYKFRMYRNDYDDIISNVNVYMYLRYRARNREEEYDDESVTKYLMMNINTELKSTDKNVVMCSMPVSSIFRYDTTRANMNPDGIVIKFETQESYTERPKYVYYELEASNFEHDNYVSIFEFVVSTEPNGEGFVKYRKHISLVPTNEQEIEYNVVNGLI